MRQRTATSRSPSAGVAARPASVGADARGDIGRPERASPGMADAPPIPSPSLFVSLNAAASPAPLAGQLARPGSSGRRETSQGETMNATLTDLPREHWQQLIDWAGLLCANGATLTVRGGALHAQGPPALLTPEILAALRRYEPAFVRLLLRADTAAVAWRVAAMLDTLSRSAGAVDQPEGAAGAGRAPRPLPLLRRAAAGGRRDRAAPTAPGRSSWCCGGCARATCAEPGAVAADQAARPLAALPRNGRRAVRERPCMASRVRPCTPIGRLQPAEAALDRALAHAAMRRDLLVAQPAPHQVQRRSPARGVSAACRAASRRTAAPSPPATGRTGAGGRPPPPGRRAASRPAPRRRPGSRSRRPPGRGRPSPARAPGRPARPRATMMTPASGRRRTSSRAAS